MFSNNLLIDKRSLEYWAVVGKNCSFQGTLQTNSEASVDSLIENRKLRESKMNAFHYLALQFEAIVILLKETHCTYARSYFQAFNQMGKQEQKLKRNTYEAVERKSSRLVSQKFLTFERP